MIGPVSPHDNPGYVQQKARSSRAATEPCRISARFHLRHGDGRYAPASSDLRLRSTFPFAGPQVEAQKDEGQGPRFVKIVMPGKQFANANATGKNHVEIIMPGKQRSASAPALAFANAVGSPQMMRLFYLPANTSQEAFQAAFEGNGSVMAPINPSKIFDGLCQWAQKAYKLASYDAAIARCKTDFPELWDAVNLLAKEPV